MHLPAKWLLLTIVFFLTGNLFLAAQPDYFFGNPPLITADPPAPWTAGQVVRFSLTVRGFDKDQNFGPGGKVSAFFHGLGIRPGACWQNLTYGPPPATLGKDTVSGAEVPGGNWLIINNPANLTPSVCSGLALTGYYFDGTRTFNRTSQRIEKIPLDGNPFNNFGELEMTGNWTFTWEAQVPAQFPMNCDLTMQAVVFGDGETGTWKNRPPGCESGSAPPIEIGYLRVDSSAFEASDTVICVNTETVMVPTSLPSGIFNATWQTDGGIITDTPSDGSAVIFWQTPGRKRVTRILTHQNTGEIFSSFITVRVLPEPQSVITAGRFNICGTDTVSVASGAAVSVPGSQYEWNFGDASVQSGAGAGPYTLNWATPGTKTVRLTVRAGDCPPAVSEIRLNVGTKPVFNLVRPDTGCMRENQLFYDTAPLQNGSIYEWTFEDGEPSHVFGTGAQRVRWRTPGEKKVRATLRTGACDTTILTSIQINPVPAADIGGDLWVCYRVLTELPTDLDTAAIAEFNRKAAAEGKDPIRCRYEWLWDPETGNDIQGPRDNPRLVIRPSRTRTYSLYAYCDNCVTLLDQITVNLVGFDDDTRINIKERFPFPQQTEICAGDKVQLRTNLTAAELEKFIIRWYPPFNLDNPDSPTPIASPTQTTAYYYQFTDKVSGCSDTIDNKALIEIRPRIRANLGPDVTLCPNRLTPYQLNPVYENLPVQPKYMWSPQIDLSCYDCPNPIFLGNVSRSYSLTVRDRSLTVPADTTPCMNNPLDDESNILIRVRPRPEAYPGPDVLICEGDTVSLGHPSMQGGPPFRFRWTPSLGLSSDTVAFPQAFPRQTTTYTLIVRAGDCESEEKTVTVKVRRAPIAGINVASIDICLGQGTVLTPVDPRPVAGGVMQYVWSPGEGLSDSTAFAPTASPRRSITYTYYVIMDGCTSLTNAITRVNVRPFPEIHPLGIGRDRDTVNCSGFMFAPAEVTGGTGGPYRYRWEPAVLVTGPDSLQTSLRGAETTVYTLTVTDLSNSCVYQDTVRVTIPPLYRARILPAAPRPLKICFGDSVFLSVDQTELIPRNPDQPYLYQWFPSNVVSCDTCPETYAKPETTMTIRVRVTHGECFRTDSVTIRVIPEVRADFLPAQDTICVGQSLAFINSSIGANRYNWDFGDGEASAAERPTHAYLEPGKYQIRLRAISRFDGECTNERTSVTDSVVVLPRPEARFTSAPLPTDTLYLPNQTTVRFFNQSKTNAKGRFQWDFGDGFGVSEEKNPVYKYMAPGKYTVRLLVTDETGCTSEETLGVFLIAEPYIENQRFDNIFTPNGDGINDFFGVRYFGRERLTMQVYDRWGNLVFDGINNWDGNLPSGSPAAEGTYFYQVKIGPKLFRGDITLLR